MSVDRTSKEQLQELRQQALQTVKLNIGAGFDISGPALGNGFAVDKLVSEIERLLADNDRLREWLLDMDYDDGCRQCQINHDHERMARQGAPPRGRPGHDEWIAAHPMTASETESRNDNPNNELKLGDLVAIVKWWKEGDTVPEGWTTIGSLNAERVLKCPDCGKKQPAETSATPDETFADSQSELDSLVRRIEIICDATNRDPYEYLADDRAAENGSASHE